MTARLRESAGARLHDLLHAMKTACEDDDQWRADTAHFFERIYSGLAFANRGTLLAQFIRATNQTAARSTRLMQQRFELRKSSGDYRISSD